MQRRTFLLASFVTTAAVAIGVELYSTEELSEKDSLNHDLLFSVLLPVFLHGALPDVPSQRELVINTTIEAIYRSINVLEPEQQQELEQLFGMLESRLGLLFLSGSITPLIMRDANQLVEMLEKWRHHYLVLLQTAYAGLRELIMTSYYSEPNNWNRLGYSKPMLTAFNS